MPTSGASNVTKFVQRNSANPFDDANDRGSPSARGSSQNRQSTDNAGLSQAERRRKAEAARMTVPQTRLCPPARFKQESAPDVQSLARTVASRPQPASSQHITQVSSKHARDCITNPLSKPRNVFDDTDLDDTISSGLSTLDDQQHYLAFTSDYNRPSYELLKTVDLNHYAQQHGGYSEDIMTAPGGSVWPEDWKEIVQAEKQRMHGGFSTEPSIADDYHERYERDQQEEMQMVKYHEDDYNSHQAREIQANNYNDEEAGTRTPEPETYDKEAVSEPTLPARSTKMPPPAVPTVPKAVSTFAATSLPTSKSSSYVEVSEDEAPTTLPPPAAKKVRLELDYSPQRLNTMSYADLDNEPFENDPRAAIVTAPPPVNEYGVPLGLQQRLGNMSLMKEEDIKAMFSAQKDQEWEDTGTWFMERFNDKMKRLMGIRQERRKILLQYEMEVRKRQAKVEAKTGDVDEELRYLKNGGKDLMDKRVSPMP